MGKQTVTPTPGAASELPWYMQELPLHVTGTHRNHVHTAKTAHVATFSDSVSAEHFAASVNGNQFATPPAPVTEGAQREEWLLDASDKLADWCNLASDALRDMMAAYERRIRTDCTPEQIEKKPWECREYIVARDVLDKKPAWVVTIPAKAEGAQREAVASPFVFNEELSAKLQGLRADMPKEAKAALVSECIALLRDHQNKIDPPPPDRVQPERVEADSFTHKRNAICERELGIPFEDTAPPTDASGGVTGVMVQAALDTFGMPPSFKAMRKALEAADRARKPGYRQVTLEDAAKAYEAYWNGPNIPRKGGGVEEMLAVLRSIGAVIPDAGK